MESKDLNWLKAYKIPRMSDRPPVQPPTPEYEPPEEVYESPRQGESYDDLALRKRREHSELLQTMKKDTTRIWSMESGANNQGMSYCKITYTLKK
jgi:hypothetical protein